MKFWHHLLPHVRNDYHPTSIRLPGLAISLVLVALLMLPTSGLTAEGSVLGYATDITTGELHSLSNQERTSRGMSAYRLDSKLSSAATAKAKHMFANDYWAHTAPDGTTPWSFISASGYSYKLAGENLAKDFSTSAGVVNGWMASSGHKANILSSTYKDVGYAAVNGTLQGKKTTLVVAMYGAPVTGTTNSTSKSSANSEATNDTPAPTTTNPATETTKKPAAKKKKATKSKPAPVSEPKKEIEAPYTSASSGEVLNEQAPPITASIKAYKGLTWQQRATIMVLAYLALMMVLKHTLVWRKQKRGYRHIWLRAHPLVQASFLLIGILLVFGSSVGVVL